MSPDLFNIYSEMILRNLENYPRVKINGVNINNIRYADDLVLIADSEENLQRPLDITIEKSEEMGLTLNVMNTELRKKTELTFWETTVVPSQENHDKTKHFEFQDITALKDILRDLYISSRGRGNLNRLLPLGHNVNSALMY